MIINLYTPFQITYKVTFAGGHASYVEYIFNDFKSYAFDMVHYNDPEFKIIDQKRVIIKKTVKQVMKDLIRNASKNGATVTIIKRQTK